LDTGKKEWKKQFTWLIVSEQEWLSSTTTQTKPRNLHIDWDSGGLTAAAAQVMYPRIQGEGKAGHGEQQTYGLTAA